MSIMIKAPNDKYRKEYDRIFAHDPIPQIDECHCSNCGDYECEGSPDGICGSYIEEEEVEQ